MHFQYFSARLFLENTDHGTRLFLVLILYACGCRLSSLTKIDIFIYRKGIFWKTNFGEQTFECSWTIFAWKILLFLENSNSMLDLIFQTESVLWKNLTLSIFFKIFVILKNFFFIFFKFLDWLMQIDNSTNCKKASRHNSYLNLQNHKYFSINPFHTNEQIPCLDILPLYLFLI